jgi:hypothetical protein
MSGIVKSIGRGAGSLLGGVAGLLGGRAPHAPSYLPPPSATPNQNQGALDAARAVRPSTKKGRAATILTQDKELSSPQTNIKTLLGG